MVGVGLEYGFTPNWSFKIEYNFMDFGGDNFNFADPIIGPLAIFEIEQQISVVKAGVNYRFNWGASVPATEPSDTNTVLDEPRASGPGLSNSGSGRSRARLSSRVLA